MSLTAQRVHLAKSGNTISIAVAGSRIKTVRPFDDHEQVNDHDSEDACAKEFSRLLGKALEAGWDLDTNVTPNPEHLPEGAVLEPTPLVDRTWKRLTETWRLHGPDIDGFAINTRDVPSLDAKEIELLREKLLACGVTSLQLVEASLSTWFHGLAPDSLPALSQLIVDTPYFTQWQQSEIPHGDITAAFLACPNLRSAKIVGRFKISKTEHKNLRELLLFSDGMSPSVLTAIAECQFPNLRSLAIGLSADSLVTRPARSALNVLLASETAQQLTSLAVEGNFHSESVLSDIVAAGLPKLSTLTIAANPGDEDTFVKTLSESEAYLQNLELRLPLDTLMDGEQERLTKRFPRLSHLDFSDGPFAQD